MCDQKHTHTDTKDAFSVSDDEPVLSLRQRPFRGFTQRPQSPCLSVDRPASVYVTPARDTHTHTHADHGFLCTTLLINTDYKRHRCSCVCLCVRSLSVLSSLWFLGMTERERQVMKKLKEVVDKQRDEIRAKDRELTLKNEDIEAVRRQIHMPSPSLVKLVFQSSHIIVSPCRSCFE